MKFGRDDNNPTDMNDCPTPPPPISGRTPLLVA